MSTRYLRKDLEFYPSLYFNFNTSVCLRLIVVLYKTQNVNIDTRVFVCLLVFPRTINDPFYNLIKKSIGRFTRNSKNLTVIKRLCQKRRDLFPVKNSGLRTSFNFGTVFRLCKEKR